MQWLNGRSLVIVCSYCSLCPLGVSLQASIRMFLLWICIKNGLPDVCYEEAQDQEGNDCRTTPGLQHFDYDIPLKPFWHFTSLPFWIQEQSQHPRPRKLVRCIKRLQRTASFFPCSVPQGLKKSTCARWDLQQENCRWTGLLLPEWQRP